MVERPSQFDLCNGYKYIHTPAARHAPDKKEREDKRHAAAAAAAAAVQMTKEKGCPDKRVIITPDPVGSCQNPC